MNEENEKIRQALKDLLREEVDWDELRREKKAFIRARFEAKPFFLFRPAFFMPAVSFTVALAAFLFLMPEAVQKPERSPWTQWLSPARRTVEYPVIEPPVPSRVEQAAMQTQPALPLVSPVSVTRLQSDVGSTMVYQRQAGDVPIVIVWVFPK